MSFYHILPSNSDSDTFPNNNAASFSVTVDPPYILDDSWEVALMNITHSNCINTFANEEITIAENFEGYSVLRKVTKPTKVILSKPKGEKYFDRLREIIKEIQVKTDNLLQMNILVDRKTNIFNISWKTDSSKCFFICSTELRKVLQLDLDTITFWDAISTKRIYENEELGKGDDELSITIGPFSYESQEIVIKKGNEDIDISAIIERFNKSMHINGKQIATLELLSENRVMIRKLEDDNFLLILGQDFHEAMRHQQGGVFKPNSHFFLPFDISYGFKRIYSVYLYEIFPSPFTQSLTKTINLHRQQFLSPSIAIQYVNDCLSEYDFVQFTLIEKDIVMLKITKENISVSFSSDLRDIFGFDETTYEGKKGFLSSAPISLSRRIQYFYIYSDVCDMVRVGDTKAPLLSILPFNAKECRLLTEKRFTLPMYVPVKKTHISSITVEIYDDAGKIIPFHSDALTSIRLHFRKQK